jgi:hypothetical protein
MSGRASWIEGSHGLQHSHAKAPHDGGMKERTMHTPPPAPPTPEPGVPTPDDNEHPKAPPARVAAG